MARIGGFSVHFFALRPLCVCLALLPCTVWADDIAPLDASPAIEEAAYPPDLPATQGCMKVEADRVEGSGQEHIQAEGDVQFSSDAWSGQAGRLEYWQAQDHLVGSQGVQLVDKQTGNAFMGQRLSLALRNHTGTIDQGSFVLQSPKKGRGAAQLLQLKGKNHYEAQQARYTSCALGREDWYLHANNLDLDYNRNVGVARGASLRFFGVPVAYVPWMDFPLNGQRKSGFLAPKFAYGSRSGYDFSMPYYWNVASNYDATFTPRYLSQRGVQLKVEGRYLWRNAQGILRSELLPDDALTGKNRQAWSWQHTQRLSDAWSAGVDVAGVSDNHYFTDLSNAADLTDDTIHLPREAWLRYRYQSAYAVLRWSEYQTLQNAQASLDEPYARKPQMLWGLDPQRLGPAVWQAAGDWTRFEHNSKVNGGRFHVSQSVRLPISRSYGYVTPKLGLFYTHYQLEQGPYQRILPLASVDAGVTLERRLPFGEVSLRQTLEPRVYYVYIPYKDQSSIPNFDTDIASFNSGQLFRENQFTGVDKINDANQLTLGLTSRVLDEKTGVEYWRASLGQRFYFQDRRVALDGEEQAQRRPSSDILLSIAGRIWKNARVDFAVQFDPEQAKTGYGHVVFGYQPAPGKTLNVGFRYARDLYRIVDASVQWPLAYNWYAVAHVQYDFDAKQALDQLYGLEYNAGCWGARFVQQSKISSTGQSVRRTFVQIELNDFGRIGSNPLDVLKESIFGYTPINSGE